MKFPNNISKRLVVSALFILFLFGACSRKEDNYPKEYLSTPLLSYFSFPKAGSYWVYEDSATKKQDSMWVESNSKNHNKCSTNRCVENEYIHVIMKSNSDKWTKFMHTIRGSSPRKESVFMESQTFHNALIFHSESGFKLDSTQKFYSQITLKNINYTNVVSLNTGSLFFAKEIGLIRIVSPQGISNLIRYNIVE